MRPVWLNIDLFGPIWFLRALIVLYGHAWFSIDLYGPVWSHMVPYGPVCSYMVLYGPLWSLMVPYGSICFRIILYGPVWASIASYCLIWSCEVLFGHIWSWLVTKIQKESLKWLLKRSRTQNSFRYFCICSTHATSAQILCLFLAFCLFLCDTWVVLLLDHCKFHLFR